MRRTLTALTLAAATVAAAPAHAEASDSQRVQVLAVMSDDGFQQAQALTIALKRAVTRAEGWSLGKGDFSLEVMVAALNCPSPPDSSCQKKIGKKVGTDRYVWGTVKLEGKETRRNPALVGERRRETTDDAPRTAPTSQTPRTTPCSR